MSWKSAGTAEIWGFRLGWTWIFHLEQLAQHPLLVGAGEGESRKLWQLGQASGYKACLGGERLCTLKSGTFLKSPER